jgi:hypothetical protein
VGLLSTEDVPASLIYFFRDGDYLFAYRGRPPLSERQLRDAKVPQEFLDFYRIHDGWVLYYSEDGGPAPHGEWSSVSACWPNAVWQLPPGDISANALTVVYRDGEDFALAYPPLIVSTMPMWCSSNGTADVVLDVWAAIDDDIGFVLEQLQCIPASAADVIRCRADVQKKAADRYKDLLKRVPALQGGAAHFGGGRIYEQAHALLLTCARFEPEGESRCTRVEDNYRQALQQWCRYIELGGQTEPDEMVDLFGLAHAVGDAATGHFIATVPTEIWVDDSPSAVHARVLFCLFRGEDEYALAFLDDLFGGTFDDERVPDQDTEIPVRLLEALCQRDARAYVTWRKRADDRLSNQLTTPTGSFHWDTRLAGFDAVASLVLGSSIRA